jgi:hypothetical protein
MVRKLKVKTAVRLTHEQQEALQRLGCDVEPFITWPHELIFAATTTVEQEQGLRALEYVREVEPMPVYRPA